MPGSIPVRGPIKWDSNLSKISNRMPGKVNSKATDGSELHVSEKYF